LHLFKVLLHFFITKYDQNIQELKKLEKSTYTIYVLNKFVKFLLLIFKNNYWFLMKSLFLRICLKFYFWSSIFLKSENPSKAFEMVAISSSLSTSNLSKVWTILNKSISKYFFYQIWSNFEINNLARGIFVFSLPCPLSYSGGALIRPMLPNQGCQGKNLVSISSTFYSWWYWAACLQSSLARFFKKYLCKGLRYVTHGKDRGC